MKHMTLSEIADACCGIYCGDPAFLDCEVSSVAIDSRKVVKDTLFVAIKGARVDGHSFIPQVMEAGALCSSLSRILVTLIILISAFHPAQKH